MAFYGRNEQWWRALLAGDNPNLPFRHFRYLLSLLPSSPRCKFCHAPFAGAAGPLMKVIGKGPSRLTPDLCHQCAAFAQRMPGGAEVELSMLFADIRGSTTLAEEMSTLAFSQLISRFFATSTDVLIRRRAWIDRLVGDQVIGLFVPGFAGQDHAHLAVRAAQEMLREMGHADSDGPWVPVGIGVHTEKAFVGAVGRQDRATDITVLGDAPNTAARLASAAATGEILMSESTAQATFAASDIIDVLKLRHLSLKGKSEPVSVYVLSDYDPLQ